MIDEQKRTQFFTLVKDMMKDHVVTINFTKKDGTQREMNCTLNENIIAVTPILKEDGVEVKRVSPPNVIPVWDVDANAWRSFRTESVTSVRFIFE